MAYQSNLKILLYSLALSLHFFSSLQTAGLASDGRQAHVLLKHITPIPHPLTIPNAAEKVEDYDWQRHLMHTPLAALSTNGTWECLLCLQFPTLENQGIELTPQNKQHKLKVRLELHPDARWGDGSSILAKDLHFSWIVGRQLLKDRQPSHFFVMAQASKLVSGNNRAIDFFFKESDYLGSSFADIFLIPEKSERNPWKKAHGDHQKYLTLSSYAKHPYDSSLYSGGFWPQEISTQEASFAANFSYFLGKPNLSTILVSTQMKSSSTQHSTIKPLRVIKEPFTLRKDKKYVWKDTFWFEALWFNLRDPLLADIQVRRAIANVIPYENIWSHIMQNEVFPAISWHHSASKLYTFQNQPSHFQKNFSAPQSLDQSGWLNNEASSTSRQKNGIPFCLDIWSDPSPHRQHIAKSIQSELQRTGLQTTLRLSSSTQEHLVQTKSMRLTGAYLAAIYLNPESNLNALLSTEAIPQKRNQYQGQNLTGLTEPKIDQVLQKLSRTWSFEARKKVYAEMDLLIDKNLPWVPLFHYYDATEYSPDLDLQCNTNYTAPISICAVQWKRVKEHRTGANTAQTSYSKIL
ncbi:MAG: ABC transporter substrate-binding protein [Zetaproteobacteria bacterium]|nr:ABC transporter substrate-binding protein [Zetaproteobacteria bacterium]